MLSSGFFILILIDVIRIKSCLAYNISNVRALREHLFKNSGYDRKLRPAVNQSEYTEIWMKMSITSISAYDIPSGKLTISGYLTVQWTDELIYWNASDFDAVSRISVGKDQIWVPDLKQTAVADLADNYFVTSVWLENNGTASMILAGEFVGYCEVDTLFFPVDRQTCMFTVLVTSNDASEVSVGLVRNNVERHLYTEHGEWSINNSDAYSISFHDHDIRLELIGCMFRLKLMRRPISILIYTCLPLTLIAVLNMIIYVVPVTSGERVSFSVQILLTLIFFTTNISDGIPRNALVIPMLSRVMAALIFLCSLNVMVSVILCRVATECIKPVSGCLKSLTRLFLYIKLGRRQKKSAVKRIIRPTEGTDKLDQVPSIPPTCNDIEITWIMVVDMCDYIIFYVHLLVVVTGIVLGGLFMSDVL